jgi:alpha-1,3-rhamnosyl/mannosyltransferase
MRYLVDGRPLQARSSVRGIGSYARGLLAGLAELGEAGNISLLLQDGAPPAEAAQLGIAVAPVRLLRTKRRLQPLADPFLVARALRRLRPALYHGLEYGQPLRSAVPVVITVHDLIPFVFSREYPWMRRERLFALRLLRRADRLIAVSSATAADLVRIADADPARITVVAEGISPSFRSASADTVQALRERMNLRQPYLLAVGTFDPRKRMHLLAEVVRAVRRSHDVDIVIAGDQGNYASSVAEALARAGLAGHAHVTGHVPGDDLVGLYTGAACLVFTSAYEGFGLPLLEAMACGTPVAAFANSSLSEVGGSAALLSPDGDAAAMSASIAALLDDPADRDSRAAAGLVWAARFSWRRAAQETLDVYTSVIA